MAKVLIPSKSESTNHESSADKASDVNEQKDRDVIRYTLKSYLGLFEVSSTQEKQLAAVEKINNLPNGNFEELVYDIVNEVHRRCKMEHDEKTNPMRDKLMKLKEEKFKNLVFDVLQAFETRFFKASTVDLKDEISNLGRLISILKIEEETGDNIINENNEKLKFKYFVEYVKQFHQDRIIDYMEQFINENIEMDFNNNFEILFNYKMLLKKLDSSKYRKLNEYQIFKSNIERIEKMNVNGNLKKDLIKREYLNIIDLLLTKQYHFEEMCIKNNVSHLINVINTFDSTEGSWEDAFEIIKKIVHNINAKAENIPYTNKEIVFSLKKIFKETQQLNSKVDYNVFIQEIALNIRKLLENITQSHK